LLAWLFVCLFVFCRVVDVAFVFFWLSTRQTPCILPAGPQIQGLRSI
jgi:hypothetical protein